MKIINKTKNVALAEDAMTADTLFKRMKGLLGRKEFKPGQALILKPCDSIHTFFMRFPIDALFVNRDNTVIKTYSNLKPWSLSGIFFDAAFCAELPSGTLTLTKTCLADQIEIE